MFIVINPPTQVAENRKPFIFEIHPFQAILAQTNLSTSTQQDGDIHEYPYSYETPKAEPFLICIHFLHLA